jgi:UDP-N-acetylmuramate dehydrogenase
MMMIYKNVPLKKYNTFGLDYTTDCMITIATEDEAKALFNRTEKVQKPLLIIGSGSNILFTADFRGTILNPEIMGIQIEEEHKKDGYVIVSAGAGVIWDDFVDWCVRNGFGGAENLSLIPGKVGATPVQNIGAYGIEVKDLIVRVSAISVKDGQSRNFSNQECEFGYRNSIFKNSEKGNYLITRVFFRLNTRQSLNLCYDSLKEEVSKLGHETLVNVRQAVINIRRSKLPDPEIIGNAGSFFKNPVVSENIVENLMHEYPEMPFYNDRPGYKKLAAGWLIDRCGWKGKRAGDAGVHDKQALVIINYGNASGKEIYNLSEEIKKSVIDKFGIELEREVEII